MTHLLNPQTALRLTYLIERLMFPLDGYPAPSPIEPMPAEARDLRVRMDARVGEVLPVPFRAVFCPQPRDVHRILDPLDNPGCNAHLVAMLLDAVVGTLEPELVASVSVSVGVSGRDEQPVDKGVMKVEQKE